MKRKLLFGFAAIVLLLAASSALVLRTPQAYPPMDRPIALPEDTPLNIVAFGTSLTALYDWPDLLQSKLSACLDRRVTVSIVAKPGQSVAWGETQVDAVLAQAPDLILMEFAINDADFRDGLSLTASIAAHERLLTAFAGAEHPPELVLMTMNPAHGLRGLIRPRLRAYYQSYHDLAARYDTGLVDAYPRWLAYPDWKKQFPDGLHPKSAAVNQILLPAILGAMGCPTG